MIPRFEYSLQKDSHKVLWNLDNWGISKHSGKLCMYFVATSGRGGLGEIKSQLVKAGCALVKRFSFL